MLADHKQWDRALVFCRQAAAVEPNLPFAYADALTYAELAKDSQAMEWAVDGLLRQDWPNGNGELHAKARLRVEGLANTLTKENRAKEADRLRETLRTLARRDVVFHLKWEAGASGPADLEFQVKEPSGSVCSPTHAPDPRRGHADRQ